MVRATALRKLRGSKVSLSKHELEVLAQQESKNLRPKNKKLKPKNYKLKTIF